MIMESLKSTGVETQWAIRLISLTYLNVLPIFSRMDSTLEWQAYLKNKLQTFKVWKKTELNKGGASLSGRRGQSLCLKVPGAQSTAVTLREKKIKL